MLRRFLFLAVGFIGMLVAAEVVLRILPVATSTASGYYIDPLIMTYPPGHQWRTATGWDLRNIQRMQSNNIGFASDIDFVPDSQAVALIGDSYVEASMLDGPTRPGPQLTLALAGSRAVYAMGAPGSALLDYAERVRLAHQRFAVRDFVILMEAGDLRQSICGSGNVHGSCLDAETLAPRTQKVPPASWSKSLLRHFALAHYLNGQLKLDLPSLLRRVLTTAPPPTSEHTPMQARTVEGAAPVGVVRADDVKREAMVSAVADAFFARVEPYISGHLVIVVDGRRTQEGLADAAVARTPLMLERAQFMRIARSRGAVVIDAEPLYLAHLKQSVLSLSVGPYDAHLNPIGVRLLMRAVAEQLR
jgi:hypothetical protein